MKRGEIWWASLPEPKGSEPGYRRPVVLIQADEFNRSNISTILCASVTSNLSLANAPGNVRISSRSSGLRRPSGIFPGVPDLREKNAVEEPLSAAAD